MSVKIMRFDKGEIRSAVFTPEGFLKVDAIVTRTGVFTYVNEDGTLRRELRHPDDILKKDSLRTLEMIPVTLLHPEERVVDSENSQRLSKGLTGETVEIDGKFIKNRVLITNQDAIDNVLGGMQELSLGYYVELIEEDGEYDGERFDFRQTNVIYNHLAIVPSARAGKEARIVLGRNDAEQQIEVENVRLDNLEKPKKPTKPSKSTGGNRMVKVNIDGLEYEASPEVANALKKAQARNDELDGQVKTLTTEKSELQAKHDTLKEKQDAEDKKDKPAEMKIAIDARLKLISEATPHLDEEAVKKLSEMDDKEIKSAVIMAKFPKANLDEKDDTYIQARYDSALEVEVKSDDNQDDPNMASQRGDANSDDASKGGTRVDAKKSQEKHAQDMQDAWKTLETK